MNNNHGLTNTGTSNSGNNNSNRNINSNGRDTHDDNFSQFSGHGNSQSNGNNKNKNSNGYDDNISQFSGHESTQTNTGSNADRGTSNKNNNDKNHPPVMVSTSSQTNGNQGRDIYNYNQARERSTSGYDFVADSLAGSSNSGGNHNSAVTQRPFSLQTTTDYNYHGDRRPTTSSYRPVRDSTTKKSTYFQGDLPFFNHDGNDETSVSLLKVSSSSLIKQINFFQTHSILNLDGDSQCGTVIPKVNPLIVHGEETYQGQFPWHAALYLSEIGSLKYICGGSLVAMNAVITAGCCRKKVLNS